MATFTIHPPPDFDLKRDCCSYGYFLLAPNYWDVKTCSMSRVLTLAPADRTVLLRITQPKGRGTPLRIDARAALSRAERAEITRQLSRMFRLDDPAEHVREFHALDPRWKKTGRGRLFRSPTLFEDVIKTVTSCNVTWPSTVQMNRRLCEVLGEAADQPGASPVPQLHAFPTPQRLARTRPQTLRARCRVGYRDARIIRLAKLFTLPPARGGIDQAWLEDPATPDDAVFEYLIELPGIGPYAAANIMQLMGRYARLPLDTESVRHGKALLGFKGSPAQVMKRVHRHFAPFGRHAFRSYWFELWSFYESKHGPAWTWERDSTGKLFTAALLSQ